MNALASRSSSQRIRATAWTVLLIFAGTASAQASDGRIELNQTCATAGGCVAGDAPGFPIRLGAGGSYLLTSNLTVPNENTHGIQIEANDVTIDFNGFTLAGPATVPITTHVCSLPGTGTGVFKPAAANGSGLTLRDGHIRGMGARGIDVNAALARIDGMVLERNCGDGMFVGLGAIVTDTQARANGATGIRVGDASRIKDSISDNNGETGIDMTTASVVTGSVATTNLQYGMLGFNLAINNVANGNGLYGLFGYAAIQNFVDGNGTFGIFVASGGMNVGGAQGNSTIEAGGSVGLIGCNYVNGPVSRDCPGP